MERGVQYSLPAYRCCYSNWDFIHVNVFANGGIHHVRMVDARLSSPGTGEITLLLPRDTDIDVFIQQITKQIQPSIQV